MATDTLKAKVELELDTRQVGEQVDNTSRQLKTKLSKVGGDAGDAAGRSLSASSKGIGSAFSKIGRELSRTIEKGLKLGVAFIGGSIAAFLSSGSDEAERFSGKLSDLRSSYASLGQKFLDMKIGGKDMYEWVDILSEKLQNLDITPLENILNKALDIGVAVKDMYKGMTGQPLSKKVSQSYLGPMAGAMAAGFTGHKTWDITKAILTGLLPPAAVYRGISNIGKPAKMDEILDKVNKERARLLGTQPSTAPKVDTGALMESIAQKNKKIENIQKEIELQNRQYLNEAPSAIQISRLPKIGEMSELSGEMITQLEEAIKASPLNEKLRKALAEQLKIDDSVFKQGTSTISSYVKQMEDQQNIQEKLSDFTKKRADIEEDYQQKASKYSPGQSTFGQDITSLPKIISESLNTAEEGRIKREEELVEYNKKIAELAEEKEKFDKEVRDEDTKNNKTIMDYLKDISANTSQKATTASGIPILAY